MHINMNFRQPSPQEAALPQRIAGNIRELRRIRHLTQAELARRVGMRPGPMNAIEQGKHVPTGRVLFRLAETLEVGVDAILGRPSGVASDSSAPTVAVKPETWGIRESEDAGVYATSADRGDWPRAQAVTFPEDSPLDDVSRLRINQVCRTFLALEDLCGAQKQAHIPLYLPFRPNETGLEALALQVRQMLGIGTGVIFDYLELLENAGLRVMFCPLAGNVQSAAFYDPVNANAFLIVREGLNVERQLFELIKRLGSLYVFTQRNCCPGGTVPQADWLDDQHAARKFAALFLMPAASVRASVAQLGITPEQWTYELLLRMKHRFGVSAQSFLIRLKELGLIEAAAVGAIDRRIAAHYARTKYGEPDESRRILSPNGRLGDLLLAALDRPEARAEAMEIAGKLKKAGVKWNGERCKASLATRNKVSRK
jgi:transcriptional regulator with XRE-family HTH domain/Zn-dependent peptidase ImmA (M78 family)